MAATLTASRNPVRLWDIAVPGTTTITWNTGGSFNGQVFVFASGESVTPMLFDGGNAGSRTGNKGLPVKFGQTYTLTLRRVSNNALLATLQVTVEDMQQRLSEQAVATLELRNRLDPPQSINGLTVSPSVDMVRVRFRTGRPSIPLVEVETLDGEVLLRWWPLLAGLQTRHSGWLGGSDPLPQGATLRLRITVPGRPSFAGRKAKDVVRTAEFTTGTRLVDVLFDTLSVRTDGDPGLNGAGDFSFDFRAGDASTSDDLILPDLKRDIDAGDPPLVLDSNISMPLGPRRVYVKVTGADSDVGIPGPGEGFDGAGTSGDRREGSFWRSTKFLDEASVAQVFDVSETPLGVTTIPMQLNTGDFGVAFTVNGRIMTIVRPGQGVFSPVLEYRPDLARTMILAEAGGIGAIGGKDGRERKGVMVGLGADRSVWIRPLGADGPTSRQEGWSPAATAPGGAVTAVWGHDERLLLVGLDGEGRAVRWVDGRREGGWRELGGGFTGALAAVPARDGRVALFGADRDGRVLHREVVAGEDQPGEWREIGAGVTGGLIALEGPDAAVVLLAIGRDGGVVHALHKDHGKAAWRPLGGPKAGWLGADLDPDDGLLVAVLTEDRNLHLLSWRDYPKDEPERQWQDKGSYDALARLRPLPWARAADPGPTPCAPERGAD